MTSGRDEAGPAALVLGYAACLDGRDWAGFRALFTETITLDYGAIGSIVGEIPADAWTARCRSLEGFDATLHRITNMRVEIVGESAVVRSYVDAVHFIEVGGEQLVAQFIGTYRHDLRRVDGSWRITGCAIAAAGYPGGRTAFDRAFAAARARHSGAAA